MIIPFTHGSIIPMPTRSPQTLTRSEQSTLLAVTAAHARDHLTFSIALGVGLRCCESQIATPEDNTLLPGPTERAAWQRMPMLTAGSFTKCLR